MTEDPSPAPDARPPSSLPPLPDEDEPRSYAPASAQMVLAGLIFAIAVAILYYGGVVGGGLRQTAALFVGLPTLLAILLVLAPRAKTATGAAVKGTTVCLLVAAPLAGEGFICILMASPLFYLVAVAIGLAIDLSRRSGREALGLAPILPLLLMSFEGTTPELSFARDEEVVVSRVVEATGGSLEARLAAPMRGDFPVSGILSLGFPRPGRTTGSGLAPGDHRTVAVRAGKETGVVTFEIVERHADGFRIVCTEDSTPIAGWLAWKDADLTWSSRGDGTSFVTLRTRYRRLLDPAWYFGPLERAGAHEATDWILEAMTREP